MLVLQTMTTSSRNFFVLLCDNRDYAHILDYSCRKFKKVFRSILGGDVYAFSDGFEREFMSQYDFANHLQSNNSSTASH